MHDTAPTDTRLPPRARREPRRRPQRLDRSMAVSDARLDALAARLEEAHPQDAANLLVELEPHLAARGITELHPRDAAVLLECMTISKAASLLAALEPDDRVDVLEHVPEALRTELLAELDDSDAAEVRRLAHYPPDTAGGIMTTDVAALPHTMTVDDAIRELRRLGSEQRLHYVYVVDEEGRLRGVLSMRDVLLGRPDALLADIMRTDVVSVPVRTDQEEVVSLMRRHRYLALPVVGRKCRLLGLITADDVAEAAEEEATEDIQKLGGSTALDGPYLRVGLGAMLQKRGGWLTLLFLGESLTATAMGYFQDQISRAVVLALFIPLIISSGGNSGSQAATLIVRALALSELRLRDWWRVLARELKTGLVLGAWLAGFGLARVALWQHLGWMDYGPHYLLIALTVALSLAAVVVFGGVVGSMLPFALRRAGFDPATSSSPFVATLVDVTGLVIYFLLAALVLKNTVLSQ